MDQKLMDYVRRFGIQGVLVFSYSIRKLLTFPRVRLWHSWAASHLLRSFARYLFRVLHPLAIVPATTPILKLWFLWRCRYFAFTMGCLGGDLKGWCFFLFELCLQCFFLCHPWRDHFSWMIIDHQWTVKTLALTILLCLFIDMLSYHYIRYIHTYIYTYTHLYNTFMIMYFERFFFQKCSWRLPISDS